MSVVMESNPRENRLQCSFCDENYVRIENCDFHEQTHHSNERIAGQSTEHEANIPVNSDEASWNIFSSLYEDDTVDQQSQSAGAPSLDWDSSLDNLFPPDYWDNYIEDPYSPVYSAKQLEPAVDAGHMMEFVPTWSWPIVPGESSKTSLLDFDVDPTKFWGTPSLQDPSSSGNGEASVSTSSSTRPKGLSLSLYSYNIEDSQPSTPSSFVLGPNDFDMKGNFAT
ncbi:hypothetical protein DFS33DRAFT_1379346 [Desarmillaria ectypa]|nr:hypothetical protein DFS33DRAFT_1379346 [Desarmillaria ectypa]